MPPQLPMGLDREAILSEAMKMGIPRHMTEAFLNDPTVAQNLTKFANVFVPRIQESAIKLSTEGKMVELLVRAKESYARERSLPPQKVPLDSRQAILRGLENGGLDSLVNRYPRQLITRQSFVGEARSFSHRPLECLKKSESARVIMLLALSDSQQ